MPSRDDPGYRVSARKGSGIWYLFDAPGGGYEWAPREDENTWKGCARFRSLTEAFDAYSSLPMPYESDG